MKDTLQITIALSILLLAFTGQAQTEEYVKDNILVYKDHIYKENIHTATLHPPEQPLEMPAIRLGSSVRLLLGFDDLEGGVKDFSYTIIHCNANWEPSELTEFDYIDGFNTDEITEYNYSFATLVSFTHYELEIPNDNMGLTKSGNYLLKVYSSDDEKELILTRRFMIYEQIVALEYELGKANVSDKSRTHQEIDFLLDYKGLNSRNPRDELMPVVLQNGCWDSAIDGLKPSFVKNNQLIYDFQNDLVFPGGKEFRVADIGSTSYRGEHILKMSSDRDRYCMTVMPDKRGDGRAYDYMKDANGRYFIDNYRETKPEVRADYITTSFTLEHPYPLPGVNVYIFGGLSNWEAQERFKMRYDELLRAYTATVQLKQGYYNYAYATVKDGETRPNISELEGDWFETGNDYQILVYYRPFGERYDRLVGAKTFNSVKRL